MGTDGAVAGAIAGLLLGPVLAALVHSAPEPGPWWAPWRPSGRRWSDVDLRTRLAVTGVSVIGAALGGGAAGWGRAWPAFALVGLVAGPLVVIDIRIHRLPDRIVLPAFLATAALLGLAALVGGDAGPLLRALVSGVVVYLLFTALAGVARAGFGHGDAKTAALLALPLGWISVGAVTVGLWSGFALGAVLAVVLVVTRRVGWRTPFAFGPPLLLGALTVAAALGP